MKNKHIDLSDADKSYLEGLLSKGSMKARISKRVIGLLELHRGKSYEEVSAIVGIGRQMASVWASRYRTEGLNMLKDKPRPGRPVEISGVERAKITALACSEAPDGHKEWSLRLLADKIVELGYCDHISHNHVGLILKKIKSSPT